MAAQWCKEGLREAADALWKDDATPENKAIHLFSNDETISDATAYADLTLITTNGGEAVTLTKGTWASASDADPVASVYNSGTGVTWNFTGSLTVYGWAIIGATSNKVYCAENFGVRSYANGQSLTINPLTVNHDIPE